MDAVLADPSVGAVGGFSVMLATYPGDVSSFRNSPHVQRPTLPTDDLPSKRGLIMWNRLPFCPPLQQFLNFLKVLIADNGRVGMFYIILVRFAMVVFPAIWKCVGCVGFLTEGIPNVFLVC